MSYPNAPYYEPAKMADRDIGSSQSETISFTFSHPCNAPKIVAVFQNNVIKTWTEGNGITVAGDRLSASYVLSGSDLIQGLNKVISLEFSFWRAGVVEFIQNIKVVKTYV